MSYVNLLQSKPQYLEEPASYCDSNASEECKKFADFLTGVAGRSFTELSYDAVTRSGGFVGHIDVHVVEKDKGTCVSVLSRGGKKYALLDPLRNPIRFCYYPNSDTRIEAWIDVCLMEVDPDSNKQVEEFAAKLEQKVITAAVDKLAASYAVQPDLSRKALCETACNVIRAFPFEDKQLRCLSYFERTYAGSYGFNRFRFPQILRDVWVDAQQQLCEEGFFKNLNSSA